MKSNVVSKESSKQKIVVICGPTGVGKSTLALQLTKKIQGEIISADSQQVYRGMNIGTAKPTQEERKLVPHHLLDVVDPDGPFHADRFVELADAAITDTIKRGRSPFVVGGTGLYLKALLHGLCEAPPRDEMLRERLMNELKKNGPQELHHRLQCLDPETAQLIHPNHTHRLIRALEICELTGKVQSEFFQQHQSQENRYDALLIGLTIDRKELVKRIDERVDRMIAEGWVEEVKELLKKYGSEQVFHAVGYHELRCYLEGKLSLDEAVNVIKQQTRQYAKRQMTWFRKMQNLVWCAPEDVEAIASRIHSWYGESLQI